MADDQLIAIDEAFNARTNARLGLQNAGAQGGASAFGRTGELDEDAEETPEEEPWEQRLAIQAFFAVQFLWGALLFVPGAQPYRGYIRALPYVSSFALMLWYLVRPFPGSHPRATGLVASALLLLVVNLLHPTSQLTAGIAQCVFQLTIAAPLFWAYKTVRSPRQLEHVLILVFVMNFLSAGLGILQVYYPERFMPPEFSSLGIQLNGAYVDALTYVGSDGRLIIRPPGLTDQPGGAALAGGLTALLGLGLCLRRRKTWQTAGLLAAIAVGLAVVYLTQVRAVLLMVLAAGTVLGVMAFRQGRVARASWLLGAGTALVVASFLWASALGGQSVDERFLGIKNAGALQTYQENRGNFLSSTVGEMLDEYPLGAGLGRWGMMNVYFGNPAEFRSAPIHVEIQLTGWLLDGGVPMWLLYGGAVLFSLFASFRLTTGFNSDLSDVALICLAVQVFIVGFGMAGPAFNTQLGILFWALAATLHGAATPVPEGESEAIVGA